jgi:glutamine amidotransferase
VSAKVVLVDAGGTNIGSVRYALQRLGVEATLSDDANTIRSASHVIMPGVGAAEPGMRRLRERGLVDTVRSLDQPVLGICLGMQLLFEHSEEADTECLGIVPGRVRKMTAASGLRVPHMGWNTLEVSRDNELLSGDECDQHAYFVHSYTAPLGDCTIARSAYGEPFSAAVQCKNFFGVQFHPERSSLLGARVLKNFLAL